MEPGVLGMGGRQEGAVRNNPGVWHLIWEDVGAIH